MVHAVPKTGDADGSNITLVPALRCAPADVDAEAIGVMWRKLRYITFRLKMLRARRLHLRQVITAEFFRI